MKKLEDFFGHEDIAWLKKRRLEAMDKKKGKNP